MVNLKNNEKFLLFVLACVQFTHIMDFMIMMPLGPQLMRLFDISPKQFGLLVSAYTFSAGIVGFIAAFFVDRFDRRAALLVAYTGFVLGSISCGFSNDFNLLLIARIVTGAFGGISGALILAIVGDVIPLERRASAMGIVMAAFSIASVFGVPFGLYIANIYSWQAPFIFIGIAGVLIVALLIFFVPVMKTHITSIETRGKSIEVITKITKNRNQLKALGLMILLMFGQFSVIPFISPFMVSNVGFREDQLTYIYLVGGLFTIFSSPLIGKLADKHGKHKVFTILVFISLIPLLMVTNMPALPIAIVLIFTTMFFVFAGGRSIPAMAIITSAVDHKQRGSFMSINSCVQQLSAGLASLIAGSIVTKNEIGQLENYEYVGIIAVIASICTLFIINKIVPVKQDYSKEIKKDLKQNEHLV